MIKRAFLVSFLAVNLFAAENSVATDEGNGEKLECKLSNTPFGLLIRKYESSGNYDIYNATKPRLKVFPNGNITGLSLDDIIKKQENREMFAVGAYQIIPNTLLEVIKKLDFNGDDLFIKELQDAAFDDYLTRFKRPSIFDYFYKNGGLDRAAKNVAYEWASMPIKSGDGLNRGGTSNGCSSYYAGDGLNSAHLCYDELTRIMQDSKTQLESGRCDPGELPDENDKKSEPTQKGGGYAGGAEYERKDDEPLGGEIVNNPSQNISGGVSSGGWCVCEPEISTSFDQFQTAVITSINAQTNQIKNKNIKTVDKSIDLIARQNELLAKNIAGANELAIWLENLVFELEKKVDLAK